MRIVGKLPSLMRGTNGLTTRVGVAEWIVQVFIDYAFLCLCRTRMAGSRTTTGCGEKGSRQAPEEQSDDQFTNGQEQNSESNNQTHTRKHVHIYMYIYKTNRHTNNERKSEQEQKQRKKVIQKNIGPVLTRRIACRYDVPTHSWRRSLQHFPKQRD